MLRFLHLAWHIKPLAFLGLSATGFLAAPAFIRPVVPAPVVVNAAPCAPYTYGPAPVVVEPFYAGPVVQPYCRPDFRIVDRWAPAEHHHHEYVERHFFR